MQPFVPTANPDEARAQLQKVFETLGPVPIFQLKKRLLEGQFDGSTPQADVLECLSQASHTARQELAKVLGFHTHRQIEPIECFTFNIARGKTPSSNSAAQAVVLWCEEMLGSIYP